MFSEEERLASFAIASSSASTSTAKKRQSTKAASSSSLQWPHPVTGRSAKASGIPTPTILSKHGFYHSPTQQAPDAVSHFLYPDVRIHDWAPSDDPLARLEDALPGNGWCRIFRSAQMALLDDSSGTWTWQTPELLPTSKEMVQARKETFGSQWPYDGKKGWKPTSKKLAEAGFYFTPTEEEPDNAKCIYCNKSLGGWEKSDDPVHEHQRRRPDCAFFNCQLRDVASGSAAGEQATDADADQDIEPVVPTSKGGKQGATAASRKASATVSKGKKSATAPKKQPQDEDQIPTDEQEEGAATGARTAIQEQKDAHADVEASSETVPPAKKASRKTRSVSTKKLTAKTPAEEDQAAVEAEEKEQDAAEPPMAAEEMDEEIAEEEPVKILSKKKSAIGLGNGTATQSSSARPTRAASRRATKAINLLSDDGLNRKLRRPDEEDLEKREMALSDPVPFPTAASEDSPVPVTDPVQSAKPKKSRSRSKKLDQEADAVTPEEATPGAKVEEAMEEDPVPLTEDVTIIEHNGNHDDDEETQEEPLEKPKRRGGRGAKSIATSASASKATLSSSSSSSSSVSRSRKASTKATATEVVDDHGQVVAAVAVAKDALAFPSMSSEADVEPALDRSSRSVSNALKSSNNSKGTSSGAASSTGSSSRKASASSLSKKGSTKPSSAASEVEVETASPADSVDIAVDDAVPGSLPNAGSQATIRGAPRSSSIVAINTGRTPLLNLPQLTSLDLNESDRRMTLGEWLQAKADAAANEMRTKGEAQLAELENDLRIGRMAVERRLRGRA